MEILTFLASLFGGGIIGAVINAAGTERARQKERKINFLDKQIRELYGPLYYFVSQAEKLFELNNKFHDAYKEEYINKQYSLDEHTQKILNDESDNTLNIANKYVSYVEDNNNKIKEIIDSNYSLIDPDDIKIFVTFFEHHIRLKTERENGKLSTPFKVYKHIGNISFLKPEFINKIKEKFLNKKDKLQKLINQFLIIINFMKNIIRIIFLAGWTLYGIYEIFVKKEKEIKLTKFEFFGLWLIAFLFLIGEI